MDKDKIHSRMQKTIESTIKDLAKIRTGIATPTMLDHITVDYYGTPTQINHVASITVPEPRCLVIQPFEKKMLGDIEKAIIASDLGLAPNNDGNIIRLNLPILTSERRKELAKQVRKIGEEGKISVRNIRRDENDVLKKDSKNSKMSEDETKDLLGEIQIITDDYISQIEKIIADKEADILEV